MPEDAPETMAVLPFSVWCIMIANLQIGESQGGILFPVAFGADARRRLSTKRCEVSEFR